MDTRVNLGGWTVGAREPCYVVGEIGLNHNGSVLIASRLIEIAAAAGAQAVKLQKRTLSTCFTREQLAAPRESPWGSTVGEYKRAVELGREQYQELARHATMLGIKLTASCWDLGALDDVCSWIAPAWLKIASASLTDHRLLRAHRRAGLPLVLSTGMSTIEEIDAAVEVLGTDDLVLLHCTSTYPSRPEEIDLECIATLRERYRVPVGYSGHERGIATTVAAATLGACLVERHITLDRTMWGTDHAASLEPAGLERLVRDIREVERARGDGVKRRWPSEEPFRAKLRRVG